MFRSMGYYFFQQSDWFIKVDINNSFVSKNKIIKTTTELITS